MRLRSLILFQICKLQCEFDRVLSFDVGVLGYVPLLVWIRIKRLIRTGPTHFLARNKDDAYVEDRVTVGLLLLVGSHKVCPGNQFKYVIIYIVC